MNQQQFWQPIHFSPKTELDFARHMVQRIHPLALGKTGPIRLVVILLFAISVGLSFLPRNNSHTNAW